MSNIHRSPAEPGTDRTPKHPLSEREYEDRAGNEHHHTNVWMNRHDKSEGGHRGGHHPELEGGEDEGYGITEVLTGLGLAVLIAAAALGVYRLTRRR